MIIIGRGALSALVAAGTVLAIPPAHAKPDPIRNFTAAATATGIKASATVPGRIGRTAKLQQLDGRRWITIAKARTKAKAGKAPRARWKVPYDGLREASRLQAGPLAELIRLRAKAGKSTSKPKRVRITPSVTPTLLPTVPRLVGGDISSQVSADGNVAFRMTGRANWEFAGLDPKDPLRALYTLVGAQVAWTASGADDAGCTFNGGGTSTVLGGDGYMQVPPSDGGNAIYSFRVRVDPLLRAIRVQCPGDLSPSVSDDVFDLTFVTFDCPSAGRPDPVYQSPPWREQNFTWNFSGSAGLGKSGFCTNVAEYPGLLYQWSLIGVDPESAEFLAPLQPRR